MNLKLIALWKTVEKWWWGFMLIACLAMTLPTAKLIQNDSIKGDATQSLAIAYSLYTDGSFAIDGPPHNGLTNFREPLPPMVTAIYLKLFEKVNTPYTLKSLQGGEHARFVKMQNLLWVFLGLIGTWLLFNAMISSRARLAGALPTFVVFVFYFNSVYTINTLYTELNTAVMLIWLSLLLVKALQTPSLTRWLGIGLLLGMLSLTKALFVYVAPVLIIFLWIFNAVKTNRPEKIPRVATASAVMFLGMAILVAPWMVRNQILFGSPQLTEGRSGWVLYKRALLNDMSDDEFTRGFTLWGPRIYQDLVSNTSLDLKPEEVKTWNGPLRRLYYGRSEFTANDLEAQKKGAPEQAVTLYRKTSAVYVQLERIFERAGYPNPIYAGDKVMQTVALERIAANPFGHLKMSVLMFWRGIWCFSPFIDLPPLETTDQKRYLVEALNLLSILSLFYFFFHGLVRGKFAWIALATPSILMMAFYTLLSQNLPRFFVPAQPLMMLSLMLTITQIFDRDAILKSLTKN